ncbi:prephenate/arogenate dehydrogenase family protein [Cohaesibacter celericrescens]|uniref:prephenate/arogenate dehydrogenase family protein n=1 Tax=Cohaesibacter celericrescens TaxID=2067669 RepID=UPI00356199C7
MSDFLFKRMTLIGIGLLGSSIALAARQKGLVEHIAIHTRSQATLARAEELSLGDSYHKDVTDSVKDADLVIVCTPVGACEAVAKAIAPYLAEGAIVTDVGSVKASIIRQMQPYLPKTVHFIPGHPIAGTEQSGPDSGFAELFINRWCILTPPEGTDAAAVDKLAQFWTVLGSNVETMDANHHDHVLAITSHLPHLIAYNIVGTASDLEMVTNSEVIKYSAGGFRDSTRLAASDPTMWRDVFLHNKEATLEMLGRFTEDLTALQRAIRWGDGDTLYELFSRTRSIRRSIIDAGQEVDASDFGRHIVEGGETRAEQLKSDDHKDTGS